MSLPSIQVKNLTINIHHAQPSILGESISTIPFVTVDLDKAGAAANTARYELSADGLLVTDHKTGLMWPVSRSTSAMTADDALKYAKDFRLGGFKDWFIPGLERRETITDRTRISPAMPVGFKDEGGWEWTSTPYVGAGEEDGVPRAFWQVGTSYGHVSYGGRDYEAFARPCRVVAPAGQ